MSIFDSHLSSGELQARLEQESQFVTGGYPGTFLKNKSPEDILMGYLAVGVRLGLGHFGLALGSTLKPTYDDATFSQNCEVYYDYAVGDSSWLYVLESNGFPQIQESVFNQVAISLKNHLQNKHYTAQHLFLYAWLSFAPKSNFHELFSYPATNKYLHDTFVRACHSIRAIESFGYSGKMTPANNDYVPAIHERVFAQNDLLPEWAWDAAARNHLACWMTNLNESLWVNDDQSGLSSAFKYIYELRDNTDPLLVGPLTNLIYVVQQAAFNRIHTSWTTHNDAAQLVEGIKSLTLLSQNWCVEHADQHAAHDPGKASFWLHSKSKEWVNWYNMSGTKKEFFTNMYAWSGDQYQTLQADKKTASGSYKKAQMIQHAVSTDGPPPEAYAAAKETNKKGIGYADAKHNEKVTAYFVNTLSELNGKARSLHQTVKPPKMQQTIEGLKKLATAINASNESAKNMVQEFTLTANAAASAASKAYVDSLQAGLLVQGLTVQPLKTKLFVTGTGGAGGAVNNITYVQKDWSLKPIQPFYSGAVSYHSEPDYFDVAEDKTDDLDDLLSFADDAVVKKPPVQKKNSSIVFDVINDDDDDLDDLLY